ncbi:MAG: hypothetical protein HC831_30485 [Chloroflexia bacterium]|nr:hypothetical protein [Chloroflexia bacterium]
MKPNKDHLLYFDAEWVPVSETLALLKVEHPKLYAAFESLRSKWEDKENAPNWKPEEWWKNKAHTYPEFCKIICISYGYFNNGSFVIQSCYGDDEEKLLSSFNTVLRKAANYTLCGYSIKRFDMPWIAKRMMANGISPHSSISVYGKKPWEVDVFDLPEVWGQGTMGESYTPFELCCIALGIESSKDDISGSEVKEAYYNGEIERIKDYCEKDVDKTMEVAVKLIELMP